MLTTFLPADFRLACVCLAASLMAVPSLSADDAIDIGSRRELFVDTYLFDSLPSGLHLQVQQPEAGEVVLVTGEPWEGNTCAYYSIFADGDLFRMYYRGSHTQKMKSVHDEVTCYAESKDGIHWDKPKLGLFEWDGSKDNNIVWNGIGTHCFSPFRDDNPDCAAEARYKAISRGRPQAKKGLYVFQSPDAIHWSLITDEPVITDGAFDSQNLAFWDPVTKQYVAYHRNFVNGVRAIQTSTSDDFVAWTKPVNLTYPEAPNQHLYTNAIRPYADAPHIRIGFPTRYLPESQQVEPVFMSSRDGLSFHRFADPVIPQTAPEDRDGNRSNYLAHGLLQLPEKPDELSVYGTEAYYAGPDSRLRRFIYRKDGFVALQGTGEVLTRPLIFDGSVLSVNYRSQDNGHLKIEVCNTDGQPLAGFSAADCQPLQGDAVNGSVNWKKSVAQLSGRPVRLRFQLRDAELFAFQFGLATDQ